ncbi:MULTISPECIES: IS1595 family transposase [Gammaproteobacteria]|nr:MULTISPECIES: IS1595 family transposase [Gammaproteobacteria]HBY0481297.1 IS1595 family transposase [Klebsiella pneumoniae subsp. pneumoniae]OIY29708.1 transposase [Citrobacter freundii]OIZ51386.1 transposase [Citrobacter freundii]PKH29703.1 IS1595 family transposase [Shewanella sp. ALD9]QSH05133.1 IS1595 family transposase [Enterobacter hormaechei]
MSIQKTYPIGGKDYPTTWVQFLDWFHSEQACRDYLEKLRWPDGLICPKCGVVSQVQRSSRGRLICPTCRHQATVTAGTIFDKTRTELRVWFAAIWYITNQKHGVSALGLQRVLGLGSYETAWTMLHRLRRAMVRPDRELLHGEVEVDETYLALSDRTELLSTKGRKSNTTKLLVVIAVEILHPKGFGRVRIQQIERGNHDNLMPFIKASITPGSLIHTDGSPAYRQIKENGYEHRQTVHLRSTTPAHESMPGVHRVASLLQRWMMGTHHGAVQPEQLDNYLNEYVFRFNRRKSKSRGLLFYRLLQQAVVTKAVTYQDVVKKRVKPIN